MRQPSVRLTVRQLMLWVGTLAVLCALPAQLSQIFWEEPARKGAIENEMRARQRMDYAASDRENAAAHLAWHAYYEQIAARYRGEIGWGRLISLAFVGLEAGFLAWQFRLRWLAPLVSIACIAALMLLAEIDLRLPWEVKLGLAVWAFALLPVLVALLLAVAAFGAGIVLVLAITRKRRRGTHCAKKLRKGG